MPQRVVGVDAGGSSTVAAFARDGEVVRTHTGVAANASSRGVERAGEAIAAAIAVVQEEEPLDAIFVGAAGAGRSGVAGTLEAALRARFPRAKVAVRDDGYIALRAAVPLGDGLVVIAGTGSFAFALAGGVEYRAGGYGYLFGDVGSAFAIGSAAIERLLRHYDGRAPRDALTEAVERALEARAMDDVLQRIYGDEHPVSRVASVAPAVLDCANAGDREAGKIVQKAALDLAELVRSLARRASLRHAPIVFAGGLLQSNSLLTYLLETRLRNDLPHMPIHKDDVEPYLGAVAAAHHLAKER